MTYEFSIGYWFVTDGLQLILTETSSRCGCTWAICGLMDAPDV